MPYTYIGSPYSGTELEQEERYDAKTLRQYERQLKNSFVLQNMKSSREFIDILRTHKELLNDYPHLMKDVITSYFKVQFDPDPLK